MLPLSENALDDMVTREKDRGLPPLTDWDSLSTRLRAEGLIRDPEVQRFSARPWMKIAAAVTLAVGGAAVGRVSAGAPLLPAATVQTAVTDAPPAAPAEQGTLASNTSATFTSPEEAWEVLNRAGEDYQRASTYLSENNQQIPMPAATDQYRTRLAALDNVMNEMRDAMKAAPQDPVINQYYLATVGAREATLRQLGTVLPASAHMNRF
jgi:hypothetical protein